MPCTDCSAVNALHECPGLLALDCLPWTVNALPGMCAAQRACTETNQKPDQCNCMLSQSACKAQLGNTLVLLGIAQSACGKSFMFACVTAGLQMVWSGHS